MTLRAFCRIIYNDKLSERRSAALFKDIKSFFADLFKRLKNKQIAKATPIIAIICLLAILIPTLIAIWQVYFKENDDLASSDDISVMLYDGSGTLIAESSVSENSLNVSPLVDVFYNLFLSKTLPEIAPELSERKPNYKVSLSTGESTHNFSCYFTEDPEDSFILDSDGKFYSLENDYYSMFLDMEFSEAAYSSATPPALTTKDGDVVIPHTANWSYRKLNGSVDISESYTTSSSRSTYSASGSIGLSFSTAPDFCSVTVTDILGKSIYLGDLAGLSTITAQAGDRLKFSIEAEWNDANDADSFGKMKYSFDMLCKNLATFSISSTEVSSGEYFIVTAFDIEEGATPTFTPDTSIDNAANIFNYTGDSAPNDYLSYIDALDFIEDFTPSFFKDGDSLKAIVPIPFNTPTGDFTFTLASGVATSTHTVKVNARKEASLISVSADTESATLALAKKSAGDVIDLIEKVSEDSADTLFARDRFLSMLDLNFTREYSYGDRFILGEEVVPKFTALGNAYLTSEAGGKSVCAVNIGVVIATGSTEHLGKFIAVDHGLGILTWYCNLSDLNVREGDIVAKGDAIGKSGSNTLLDGNGVLLLCSVKGTLIDPSVILGKEILYTTS